MGSTPSAGTGGVFYCFHTSYRFLLKIVPLVSGALLNLKYEVIKMTRQDFIENVTEWWELLDVCRDEDCDICEDIYSDEDKDNRINDDLPYLAREYNWWTLRDILDDIPSGDGYYCEDTTDWRELDDEDFENYKADVLHWMDDGGYWEDEEDEEEYEEYEVEENPPVNDTTPTDPDDFVPIEDEDISVTELLSACSKGLKSIKNTDSEDDENDDDVLIDFMATITVKKAR